MKKLFLFIFINITLIHSIDAREWIKASQKTDATYDSLWYFHPLSIDLSAGGWIPLGKLSEYYHPSAAFGGSLGFIVSKKARIQFWIMPILLNQKKPIEIKTQDSTTTGTSNLGASLGGFISYSIYKNKNLNTELILGITSENLDLVAKPHSPTNETKDSINVSGIGISTGINVWINTNNNLNFGIRTYYTYTTYDNSDHLSQPIGGHSISLALVYRFWKRDQAYSKWY